MTIRRTTKQLAGPQEIKNDMTHMTPLLNAPVGTVQSAFTVTVRLPGVTCPMVSCQNVAWLGLSLGLFC